MIEPRLSRPADDEGRIFDEDDTDLAQSQEFDKALAVGAEALQKGDPGSAKTLLEKALRYKPRNQRARNLLGLSLFKLGELEKAESLYRGLIEDHPADPTLRVNLGLVFLKSGAAADAVRCFETAIDLQPEHGKSQNYLGIALAQKGDHARAREWFLKCGNVQMADRMTQLLATSPIREVAAAAEKAVEEGRPFKSALPEDTQETLPVKVAPDELPPPEVPAGEPAVSSRWMASLPAAPVAPPVVPERPLGRALGRLSLSRRSADEPEPAEPPEPEAPPHAEEGAAAEPAPSPSEPLVDPRALEPVVGLRALDAEAARPPGLAPLVPAPLVPSEPVLLVSYSSSRRLEAPPASGTFSFGKSEVLVQVRTELLTRLDGLLAAFGTTQLKPELKRFRGKATDKPFGEGARHMLRASGEGRFLIAKEGRHFTGLELGDEPAYFREETLFAFEEALVFENGRVPSKTGADLHLVHLRGRGQFLLVTAGHPRAVDVKKGEPLRIPMDRLVGWHGPLLQPRLISVVEDAPELGIALELSGEGRALIDVPEDP